MKTIVLPLTGFASILGIVKLCYTLNLQAYYAVDCILTEIFYPPDEIFYYYEKYDEADKANKCEKNPEPETALVEPKPARAAKLRGFKIMY